MTKNNKTKMTIISYTHYENRHHMQIWMFLGLVFSCSNISLILISNVSNVSKQRIMQRFSAIFWYANMHLFCGYKLFSYNVFIMSFGFYRRLDMILTETLFLWLIHAKLRRIATSQRNLFMYCVYNEKRNNMFYS